MLTSLSHAKTLLVSRSVLPVSPSNSTPPTGQLRVSPLSMIQFGHVVGLLLYAIGVGVMRYELTVTGKNEKWFSSSY